MSTRPHVLVIGGGSIGERHVRCFLNSEECDVPLCEPDAAKRERLGQEYSLRQVFPNFDQVSLADFSAVVVATPAPFHISQSVTAARAGCHVLCEKPLSDTNDGIQELIDTLRHKERIGATAYTLRSITAVQRMKAMIDDGRIGVPRFATAIVSQHFPTIRPDYRQIYFASKSLGGGVLTDMCPHLLNLLEWFLGPEQELSCIMDRLVLDGIETDDVAALNIRYKNGALAQINTVMFGRDYRYEVVVHGTEGTLAYDRVKSELSLFKDGAPTAPPVEVERFAAGSDEPYIEQAKRFLAAMRDELAVACSLEEGWQTLSAVLAAQRSVETGRREPVQSHSAPC